MHNVRRNTREFKKVAATLKHYARNPQAKRTIKLYALKPGKPLEKKILINQLKQNRDILYQMQYESILAYLNSSSRKLYREEGKALYYFKTSAASNWYEFPFEFTGLAKKNVQKFIGVNLRVVR